MDILQHLLGSILLAVLIPVATAIGALLGRLLKKGIAHIDNTLLQQLAWQAVLWVEQTFKDLDNKKKFNAAYDWISRKLPGVDSNDIEKAIEAAVKQMNGQFPKAPGPQPK